MTKRLSTTFLFLLVFISPLLLAHPGGHGPVSEEQAIAIASNVVDQFTEYDPGLGFGKLKTSWTLLTQENKSIHTKGDGYYIVRLNNKAEGKNLYILMSINGEVYDANFTGKFRGIR